MMLGLESIPPDVRNLMKILKASKWQVFSQVDKLKSLRLDVPQVTELAYELKKAGLPVKDGIIRNEELVEELKRLDNN